MKFAFYCFHKTGSMFIYRYCKFISRNSNYKLFSVENGNGPTSKQDIDKFLNQDNIIIAPVRICPSKYFNDVNYIIHIRDPIDILISEYYSFGYTHPLLKNKK